MKQSIFKKISQALVAASLALSPLTALAAEEVVVGGNFELSGDAAEYGIPMTEGAKLAVKEWNDKGGINGMTIKYIERDNQTEKTEAAVAVTDLASQGAVGIVGPATSGNAEAAIPIAVQENVVAVFPAAIGDGITQDDKGNVIEQIFRVCSDSTLMSKAAAQYTRDQIKAEKIAIVTNPGSDYSLSLSDVFQEQVEKYGMEIVTVENFQTGDRDFMTIVTNLSMYDFDLIYMPAYYPEAGPFIRQLREAGIEAPVFGAGGFSNMGLVEAAGAEHASNIYYTQDFDLDSENEMVIQFKENFKKEYNKEADVFAAQAYDSMNTILAAVERAGSTDPEAVKKEIANTKGHQGVTGTFDIDELHNVNKPGSVVKLIDGVKDSTTEVIIED